MTLEQLQAEALSQCAFLGAQMGGFLGNMTTAQLMHRLSTRPNAEQLLADIGAGYSASSEKTNAMNAVQNVINAFPSGG